MSYLRIFSKGHSGAIYQFSVQSIHYSGYSESIGRKTGESHLCAVHCAANPVCSGSSICMPESDMLLVCKLTSLSALIDVRVCTAEHKYWVNRNRICSYCSQTVDYHLDTHLKQLLVSKCMYIVLVLV